MKGLKVVKVSRGWLLLQPEMSALQFRPMFEVDTLRSISLGNLLALKGQQMKHWPHQALPEKVSGSIAFQNCLSFSDFGFLLNDLRGSVHVPGPLLVPKELHLHCQQPLFPPQESFREFSLH